MYKLNKDEIKTKQIEMLGYIHKICQDNGLLYSLWGGSLLGAIRHKGYIPWDDDMDIILPYDDYCKLLAIIIEQKKYNLATVNTHNHMFYYSKIMHPDTMTIFTDNEYKHIKDGGVFIDIFPLLPYRNKNAIDRFNINIKCLCASLESKVFRYRKDISFCKNVVHSVFVICCKIVGQKKWRKKLEKYISFNANEGRVYNYNNVKNKVLPKEMFAKTSIMPFENISVCVFNEFDEILSSMFGNYMDLPPIEYRKPPHPHEVMIKKES